MFLSEVVSYSQADSYFCLFVLTFQWCRVFILIYILIFTYFIFIFTEMFIWTKCSHSFNTKHAILNSSDGMSTLNISKELNKDNWMIKRDVDNITKLRTRISGKGFKNMSLQKKCKLNEVIGKQPLLTSV